jgi:hypothetical protein
MRLILAGLIFIATLTGCSQAQSDSKSALEPGGTASSNSDAKSASSALPVPAPTPTPEAPTPTPSQATADGHTWVLSQRKPDGSTWTATLVIGTPVSVSEAEGQADSSALASCDLNSARDAVVPMTITNASTTQRFAIEADTTFQFASADLEQKYESPYDSLASKLGLTADEDLSVGFGYGDHACDDAPASFGLSNDKLEPSTQSAGDLVLVLRNFYSPAHPHGDSRFFSKIFVWSQAPYARDSGLGDGAGYTTAVTGPRVTKQIDAPGFFFPINATTRCNDPETNALQGAACVPEQ